MEVYGKGIGSIAPEGRLYRLVLSDQYVAYIPLIGVRRFRILGGGGGGARFRILGGGQIPSRDMTS